MLIKGESRATNSLALQKSKNVKLKKKTSQIWKTSAMIPKAKSKATSFLALQKSKDAKLKKKTSQFQKNVQRNDEEIQRGVIYISRIPYGFFETGLTKYFSQFGELKNVMLARSKKTGASCGYAYVEFESYDVARIVAKVMDGYLTFGKIMKCECLDPWRVSPDLFKDKNIRPGNCPLVKRRASAISKLNQKRTKEQEERRQLRLARTYKNKVNKLKKMGINLDLGLPEIMPQPDSTEVTEDMIEDKTEVCEDKLQLTEEQEGLIKNVQDEIAAEIKGRLVAKKAKKKKGKKSVGQVSKDVTHEECVNENLPSSPVDKDTIPTQMKMCSTKKNTLLKTKIAVKKTLSQRNSSDSAVAVEIVPKNKVFSTDTSEQNEEQTIKEKSPMKWKLNKNQGQANKLLKKALVVSPIVTSESVSKTISAKRIFENSSETDQSNSMSGINDTYSVSPSLGTPLQTVTQKPRKNLMKIKTPKSTILTTDDLAQNQNIETRNIIRLTQEEQLSTPFKKSKISSTSKKPKAKLQKSKIVKETTEETESVDKSCPKILNVLQSAQEVQLTTNVKEIKTPKKSKTHIKRIFSEVTSISEPVQTDKIIQVAHSLGEREQFSTRKKLKITKKTLPSEVTVYQVAHPMQALEEQSTPTEVTQLHSELKKSKTPKKRKVDQVPEELSALVEVKHLDNELKKAKTPKKGITPKNTSSKITHSSVYTEQTPKTRSGKIVQTPKMSSSGEPVCKKRKFAKFTILQNDDASMKIKKNAIATPVHRMQLKQKFKPKILKSA